MVVRRRRKSKKLRGSRTYGWGIQGQHRGSGLKGGKGKAGRKSGKHLWSWVLRYAPDYFGKHGFKPPAEARMPVRAIDVGRLDEELEKFREMGLVEWDGEKYRVDLRKLGYNKLLGSGRVTRKIIIIGDVMYTKKALEKIRAMGGDIEATG